MTSSTDISWLRPRERLREKGAGYLGDEELLALLIGTGFRGRDAVAVARALLRETGGIGGLSRQGLGSLTRMPGMGIAKAARVLAAVELGSRLGQREGPHRQRLRCSDDIFRRYRVRMGGFSQEVFLVVGLNNKNEVVTEAVVAMGGVDECPVSPREVFRPLIAEACARMIALHNHPSGDCTPSPEDVALTRRIASAGELLGIPLLDHLVLGEGRYTSLRDLGMLGQVQESGAKITLVSPRTHRELAPEREMGL